MVIHKAPVNPDYGSPLPDQVEDKLRGDDSKIKKYIEKTCHSRAGGNPAGAWNSLLHTTGALEITN